MNAHPLVASAPPRFDRYRAPGDLKRLGQELRQRVIGATRDGGFRNFHPKSFARLADPLVALRPRSYPQAKYQVLTLP